ncbi:signal peptide peptidase-like 2A isoform X2 [Ctenopharyngodon idella]|uniref:signal peptide peptidase-like 2A isoform X2 n=1 Tax=Ctenopharyngodon idella TaxID=7959 RepID=UPI00222E21FB|nr:signal peptide peptidase-like 2A isoform X2 [Ctenopharyngodon idella]
MAVKVLMFLLLLLFFSQVDGQEAILRVSNGSTVREYCLVYNSTWSNISQSPSEAVGYPLVNLTSSQLCDASHVTPGSVKGKAVVVMRGGCEFSQKALVAQTLNAPVLLIASINDLVTPAANDSEYSKVNIPLALLRYRDFLDALEVFPQGMEVRLYAPPVPSFDASIIVMLLIAVFTVTMGGFWSGAAEKARQAAGPSSEAGDDRSDSSELSLYSPLKVLLFVAMMCVMLVLMYFFYKWLVYVIIVIFCLASASALYNCLDSLMTAVGCGTLSVSCRERSVSVRSLLLAAVCITLSVIWGVYRNDDRWIWILQDLLGIAFCLNFLKTISLSNFKICVILLSLLLLYDVFFVFITPFLTANGESIMVQVALGPGAGGGKGGGKGVVVPADPSSSSYEKLPVVMRIPQFSAVAQNLCMMQFSILGYGDIIIPGLLVAYCHRFDMWTGNSRRTYFISCAVAYAVGLMVTFAVMLLSKMGQPALLYLVPCTLLTSSILASVRKEFKDFWAGTSSKMEPLDTPER